MNKKFRVWDIQDKSFYSLEYLREFKVSISFDGQTIDQDFWGGTKTIGEDVIVQHYIGLSDKNGIEIYEGDIIQYNVGSSYDNISFVVKWCSDSLSWIFQSESGEVLTNCWTPNGNRFNFIEIKGNIFENPELLK